jgi:hypothetical protein
LQKKRDPQSLISELLAKPAYGERWARVWLDVVRYADTNGYQVAGRSNFYPYAYTYRDWIVKSLNDDMPYDKFVSYQLAADRLTAATPNAPRPCGAGLLQRRRAVHQRPRAHHRRPH